MRKVVVCLSVAALLVLLASTACANAATVDFTNVDVHNQLAAAEAPGAINYIAMPDAWDAPALTFEQFALTTTPAEFALSFNRDFAVAAANLPTPAARGAAAVFNSNSGAGDRRAPAAPMPIYNVALAANTFTVSGSVPFVAPANRKPMAAPEVKPVTTDKVYGASTASTGFPLNYVAVNNGVNAAQNYVQGVSAAAVHYVWNTAIGSPLGGEVAASNVANQSWAFAEISTIDDVAAANQHFSAIDFTSSTAPGARAPAVAFTNRVNTAAVRVGFDLTAAANELSADHIPIPVAAS